MLFATYFPLPLVLADAPAVAALPAGATFDTLAAQHPLLAMLVPLVAYALFSAVVGELNEVVRKRDAAQVPVSPGARFVLAVLNATAANLDKSRQQAAKAKEPAP